MNEVERWLETEIRAFSCSFSVNVDYGSIQDPEIRLRLECVEPIWATMSQESRRVALFMGLVSEREPNILLMETDEGI